MHSKKEIIEKIVEKKEFSKIPLKDVEIAFNKFDKEKYSDEEKVKLTRDLLRKVFSGVAGKKLLGWRDKTSEEILQKHLSTRERYTNYSEIYSRVLRNLPKKFSVIDLGAGVNGLSYGFLQDIGDVTYLGVEAIGQLVEFNNHYFMKNKIKNAKTIQESLFETQKIVKLVKEQKSPRVVFMFKVVDALESMQRDYTKILLDSLSPLVERFVISLPTESWARRKTFLVQRTWLINFVKEKWQFIDDFNLGGERYLVFEHRKNL